LLDGEDIVEFDSGPFARSFIAGVKVRRAGRFLASSGWLENGVRAAVVSVLSRVEEEKKGVEEVRERLEWPIRHRGMRNQLTPFEVAAVVCVGVAVVMFVLQVCVCNRGDRRKRRDVDERALLAEYRHQDQFPMYPYGYATAPWQPPQGLFFPVVAND
jgi:hypothetical protein